MRIDVHAHYFPKEYTDCLVRLGHSDARAAGRVLGGPPSLDAQVAALDAVGIDLQVLSISQQQPYLPNAVDAAAAARLINDIYADVTRGHGGRFAAFGCLPLPHVDAALAEVERCLDTLGMVGVTVGCTVAGRQLDDPAFEPLYAELDRRGAVLFLHPVGSGLLALGEDPFRLSWMIGAPFEDSVAALQLVMAGVPLRYPRLQIIVPHLGGTLPFLVERIDGNVENRRVTGAPVPFEGPASAQLRRFWFDTVNAHPAALQCACHTWGADRLLLGTDYPYWTGQRLQRLVDYPTEVGLTPDETGGILGATAQRLLGLAPRGG